MLSGHDLQSHFAIFIRIFGNEHTAHPAESQQLPYPIPIDDKSSISTFQKSLGLKWRQQLLFDQSPSCLFGRCILIQLELVLNLPDLRSGQQTALCDQV